MTIFERRVVSGLDDVEQRSTGAMSFTSTDLELVDDIGSSSIGQRVGIRFTGVNIPQGAIITNAYLQFQTDQVGSTATSLLLRGEDADNASAFVNVSGNVSSRTTTDASTGWTPAAWTTVGQAGLDQRSPDLSAIVQEIVSRAGWSASNAMAFIITGSGARTAESFEGGATIAPLLHIEYILPTGGNAAPTLDLDGSGAGAGYAATFTENSGGVVIADVDVLIADADDANMERATLTLTNAQAGDQLLVNAAGLPAGITVDPASTATNVILTGSATKADYQTALRQVSFNNTSDNPDNTARVINVTVNDGAANPNTAAATIAIDRAPDAVGDTATTLQNTAVTTGNVLANDDPGDGSATITAFNAVSAGGGTVVNNNNGTFTYTPATGFVGTDTFTYTIADADGDSSTATVAVTVAANTPTTIERRVVSGLDDVEEGAAGGMSLTSSDLELVDDIGSNRVGQIIGIRFTGLTIPQGANVTSAYIQFQTDEVGSAATSLLIRGEDADDAAPFANVTRNVSARADTDATAAWAPAAWATAGQAGLNQRSPDLSAIVQEIVSRTGWLSGNDMVFTVTGTGTRTAEAFEDLAAAAPLLHIEYVPNATPTLDLASSGAGTGYAATYTESAGAVVVANVDTLITDADDANIERATITLTNAKAGDQLLVTVANLPAGITVDPASTATNVILTGSATKADYQTALRQVSFNNTSDNPDNTARVINVTVNDGSANSNTAVATIAIDLAPDAVGDAVSTEIGVAVTTGNVLVNDDQGNAPATITAFNANTANGGTVVNNGNATFTYTPAAGFSGFDTFTYTIADVDGDTSAATVTVSVGINDAPTGLTLIGGQPVTENAAGAVVGTLSVSDPDQGDTHTFSLSGSQFEVVGNQLKLKDGIRLDFERGAQVSLDVTATDQDGLAVVQNFAISVGDVSEVRFAAFGDKDHGPKVQAVANLVASLNVDFIVTTGDNYYGSTPVDDQVGRYYSSFIGNYAGAYGTGSEINRFFPTLGNHDYDDLAGGGNGVNYFNYFTLPGNERYYDFQMGPIHFFALNSNPQEPDGRSSASIQAQWLQSALANTESPYSVVFFHDPPFSSGTLGSVQTMRWPFEAWGATAVFGGSSHNYERVLRDDNADGDLLPYFVTGLGGRDSVHSFVDPPVAGSAARYNSDFGTMLIQASDATMTFEFWSIAGGGTLIDSYTIDLAGANPLTAGGNDTLTGGAGADFMNGLSGDDRLNGLAGNDTLIGSNGNDAFVFQPGFGRDVVADFAAGAGSQDVIEFQGLGYSSFSQLIADAFQSGVDTVIEVDQSNTITLLKVGLSQLHQDDFRLMI